MARIKAHLTLVGENFDFELVSKRTSMPASWLRTKDELLNNGRPFGHTEWGIETKCIYTDEIVTALEELIKQITCEATVLKKIAEDCKAEWNLLFDVDYKDGDFPSLYFPAEYISYFASFNASIGFDTLRVYDY